MPMATKGSRVLTPGLMVSLRFLKAALFFHWHNWEFFWLLFFLPAVQHYHWHTSQNTNIPEGLNSIEFHIGAILLKGFQVNSGEEFQSVIQEFCPKLSKEYRGTSPRRLVPGTQVMQNAYGFFTSNHVHHHVSRHGMGEHK